MEIFKLFGSIFVDSTKADESISKTGEKARGLATKLGNGIATAAKWGAAVAAGAAVVGGAMMAAAGKVAETTDEIDKASRRAGTSAEEWQKLNYAFGQSGIESTKLEATMIKNQKALNEAAEGGKKASQAYEDLGISIKNSGGSLRKADDVYQETLLKLADMEDLNKRNAIANSLFGKSYGDLAPLLDSGSAGITDLTTRAEKLGLVLSQDVVDAGVLFGDTMDDIKQVGGALFNMIAAQALPILQKFLDFVIEKAPVVQEKIGEVGEFIRGGIEKFVAFWEENGETITKIASAVFQTLWKIVQAGMDIIKGIIDVVMGLIHGDWQRAVDGLVSIFGGAWTLIKSILELALDGIVKLIKGAGKLIKSAGKALLNEFLDGMKETWETITEWVGEKIKWLTDKLDAAKKLVSDIASLVFGGGQSENDTNSKNPKSPVNGSHAAGLARVPYDGYVAQLHKDEEIVPANQTTGTLDSLGRNGVVVNQYFYGVKEERTAFEVYKATQRAGELEFA